MFDLNKDTLSVFRLKMVVSLYNNFIVYNVSHFLNLRNIFLQVGVNNPFLKLICEVTQITNTCNQFFLVLMS